MKAKKTILLTAPYFPPHMGGLERYVQELSKHLSLENRYNVVVLTSGEFKGKDLEETIDGVRIFRLAPRVKISNTPFALSWFFKVRRILRTVKPDLINIHTPVPGIGELAALFAGKTPVVVTYHADTMKKGYFVVDSIIWAYEHLVLPFLLARANHIVCSSDTVRDGFLRQYLGKSSTITPGVDTVLFSPDPAKRAPVPTIQFVAALGKAEQYKGLHMLLRAVSTIKKLVPDIRLVVTGTGDMIGGYKIYAKELGLEHNVEFTGPLVGAALAARYQAAHAFALTSSKESFGMVALEAMACGVPVVASRVGALPSFITDRETGFLFDIGDEAVLTEKLLSLVHNPEQAMRMGEAACARVREGFSWTERGGRYETEFTKLISPLPLIVQIGAYYPPALGGVEKVIETTATSLAKVGHEVLVLTSDHRFRTETTTDHNLTVRRIPSFEFAHVPFAPTLGWHLWQIPRASLVHFHLAQAYWPERVFLMCKLRRIPYIVHFHLDIEPSGVFGLLFVIYKKLFWGPFLRSASQVIVCAEQQSHIVIEKYNVDPRRVTVILNAVSNDFFTTEPRKELGPVLKLLYVGRLAAQKRVERLIEMMAQVPVPCELTVVGDGDCRADLEQLTASKGLTNVTFVGAKNSTEIKALFAQHDALLISSDREGMPLVVLEAMAAGLPIVGSNVIGITELISGVGMLVNEPYPENFAKVVGVLAHQPALLQKLSQQSVEKAHQYSWEVYNEKVNVVYKKVYAACLAPFSRGGIIAGICAWWGLIILSSMYAQPDFQILRAVIGFSFLLFVPGYLTLAIFCGQFQSRAGRFVMTVGVSLFELMALALAVNTIAPRFGYLRPLDGPLVGVVGSIVLLVLLATYAVRATDQKMHVSKTTYTIKDFAILAISADLLALSILGANQLNNGGDGTLTLAMLFGAAGLAIFVALKKGLHEHTTPTALYAIALSLLFMTSLRGDFIIGHDIQREFSVFELTKYYGLWSMSSYHDAYNACLSITLLPTVLANLLAIPDAMVFKVFFQMLFAMVPVMVYLMISRVVTRDIAFIAAFFFVSFSTFFTDMPFLIRQEIAFFFLILLFFTLFGEPFVHRTSRVLPLVFGTGMVLSHYATTYTVIGLFVFVLLARVLISLLHPLIVWLEPLRRSGLANFAAPHIPAHRKVTWLFVIFLLAASFAWSSAITNTASNSLSRVVQNTVDALTAHSWQESQSGDLRYSLFGAGAKNDTELLAQYQASFVDVARTVAPKGTFYTDAEVAAYPIQLIKSPKMPLSSVGQILTIFHIPVSEVHYAVKQFFVKSLQIFIIIGFFMLFFSARYLKRPIEIDFALMAIANLLMVAVIVLLPMLSIEYGVLRAFQQSLMFLGLFAVIGIMNVVWFLRKSLATGVVLFVAIVFFLSSTGALAQLTGGGEQALYMNNAGSYYDLYYIRAGEIAGLKWLAAEMQKHGGEMQSEQQIHLNAYASLPAITDTNNLNTIYPGLLRRDTYVYLSYFNVKEGKSNVMYNDSTLTYQYPIAFLEKEKKLVYDNGVVKIFK